MGLLKRKEQQKFRSCGPSLPRIRVESFCINTVCSEAQPRRTRAVILLQITWLSGCRILCLNYSLMAHLQLSWVAGIQENMLEGRLPYSVFPGASIYLVDQPLMFPVGFFSLWFFRSAYDFVSFGLCLPWASDLLFPSFLLVPTALLDRCLSCSHCWPGTLAASSELSSALKPGDQVSPLQGATQVSRVLAHNRAPGLTIYWDERPGIMPSVMAIYQAML